MKVLILISLLCFIIYTVASVSFFKKIPESISETSYLWKEKTNIPLFTILCLVIGFFTLPWWIECSPIAFQFLPFISCSGILFAGATPLFKEDLQKQVHYSGGLLAFLSGIVWLMCNCNWISLLIAVIITGICCILKPKSYVFFTEVIFYTTIVMILI